MQPLRDRLGRVVTVTSGYRSPMLCQEIGSTSASRHCTGDAIDAECFSISTAAFALAAYNLCVEKPLNSPPAKLILEAFDPAQPNSGWVHFGFAREGEPAERVPHMLTWHRASGYAPLSIEQLTELSRQAREAA